MLPNPKRFPDIVSFALVALNSAESIPEQTGPLITPAALPTLNPQQIQQLQMAKKYCQDITNKFVSTMIFSTGHIDHIHATNGKRMCVQLATWIVEISL